MLFDGEGGCPVLLFVSVGAALSVDVGIYAMIACSAVEVEHDTPILSTRNEEGGGCKNSSTLVEVSATAYFGREDV